MIRALSHGFWDAEVAGTPNVIAGDAHLAENRRGDQRESTLFQ
jgi:hypothetical protein